MPQDNMGYKVVALSDKDLAKLYEGRLKLDNLDENEYVLITDMNGDIVDKFCFQNDKLRKVEYKTIESSFIDRIKPKNVEQEFAIDLLQDKDIKVKIVRGVAGSGKDYLMLSQALSLIEKNIFDKIIYIRPNVTVKNVPDIGYLPNGINEKLSWTLGPLYDKVGGEEGVNSLIRMNTLEMVPLLFLRGRSFEHSIIYVSEGQNITTEIAKLIISRIGEGSELWLNADNNQSDKDIFDKDNGVKRMVNKLSGNKLFGSIYMNECLRSETAKLSSLLD